MAALQSIRNRGKFLVGIVGLALFAFIAEEGVRSCSSMANENRQKVGEVYGKGLDLQQFNKMVDEHAEFVKQMRGNAQLDEQAMYQVREQVWQNYVTMQLVKHECDKVGLMVTDAEVQDALLNGNGQILTQFSYLLGQNGRFDYTAVQQILAQYELMKNDPTQAQALDQLASFKNLWTYVEGKLREELLQQKFYSLLNTAVGNDILAEAAFAERTNQADVVVAALPYTTVADDQVTVDDKDLKAKYDETNSLYLSLDEMRSIEAISVKVVASEADRQALRSELQEIAASIAETPNMAKLVRESASEVAYSPLPVSRRALPRDIASHVDTMAVGQVEGPFESADNTMNVVRLINKVSLPDSVEFRLIFAPGQDVAASRLKADSIIAEIKSGTPFDTVAAHNSQEGTKNWATTAEYEGRQVIGDNVKIYEAIFNGTVGNIQTVETQNGCIVLEVTDRRNIIDKYDVAIVKRSINFSKETYTRAYNELSSFLAENKTAEAIRENAPKKNYNLRTEDIEPNSPNVLGIASTRDAIRWTLDEDRKLNDVSPLYECGDNDNLLVLLLTSINERGYQNYTSERVSAQLRNEVLRDKKADKLMADMAGKSVDEVAKMAGAVVDTVKRVSFAGNMYVPAMRSSEPNVAAALVGKNVGETTQAVKGNSGVYTLKVTATNKSAETLNLENERDRYAMNNNNLGLRQLMYNLVIKANVIDHRYIFY